MQLPRIVRQLVDQRQKRGFTQMHIAQRMNTRQSSISELESGRVNPTIDTVIKYAEALGLEVVLTFKESDESSTPSESRGLSSS